MGLGMKYETIVNDRTYRGPHNHIVALLGSDSYSVNGIFAPDKVPPSYGSTPFEEKISISICALTKEISKKNLENYAKLCE